MRYDPACDKPLTRDDSDLCAQWATVGATEEGNRLNRVGLLLGAIEFGGLLVSLVFTGWAAIAAAKAAKIAEGAGRDAIKALEVAQETADAAATTAAASVAANSIAEQTAITAYRPWLSLKVRVSRGLRLDENGSSIGLELTFTNHGKTPALDTQVWTYMYVEPDEAVGGIRDAKIAEMKKIQRQENSGFIVFPGEEFKRTYEHPINNLKFGTPDSPRMIYGLFVINYRFPGGVGATTTARMLWVEDLAGGFLRLANPYEATVGADRMTVQTVGFSEDAT